METGPDIFSDTPDERVEQLADGFERLGDTDTPYTLRAGAAQRAEARHIHEQRSVSDQALDEQSNEPVTRDIDEWNEDIWACDFPGVDTIPAEIQRKRVEHIAAGAQKCGFVTTITHGVEFNDPNVRGRFWYGVKEIETRAEPTDFPGYRKEPALAHELGHAVYHGMMPSLGYHETPQSLFDADTQRSEARSLSERLHGPISEPALPGISNYRTDDEELFAEVFACRVIEPEAAQRIGPAAVDRVEELLDTHLEKPLLD